MGKIVYLSYYGEPTGCGYRIGAPAADTKINYLCEALKNIGDEIEIISLCEVQKREHILRKHPQYLMRHNGIQILFLPFYESKIAGIRFLGRRIVEHKLKKILFERFEDDYKIIIYHSLNLQNLYRWLKKKHISFISEVEEIYADVIGNDRLKEREMQLLRLSDSYVFSTELLNDVINLDNKPYLTIPGTLKVEKDLVSGMKFRSMDSKIHCVYAGTLDPRKGGAIASINAFRYLGEEYVLHILGFGTDKEVANIKKEIASVSKTSKSTLFFDGVLTGDEYIAYLQKCDIGLSTQNTEGEYNNTSFPSKILTYLANGLHVVTVRIPVIEHSVVDKLVNYCESQESRDIADAILRVDVDNAMDSRLMLQELAEKFEDKLEQFMRI